MKNRIVLSMVALLALCFGSLIMPVACGIGTSPSFASVGEADDEPAANAIAPDLDKDPGGFAASMLNAAKAGKWRLLAGGLLVVVVWLTRRFGSRAVPWLSTDRGGVALVLILGVLVGMATALAADAPITLDLLLGGISIALGGAGTYVAAKKSVAPRD